MQYSTTVTFQADKVKREESAEHDFRANITDPEFFKQKGHEHIIPSLCKFNVEITNEKLEDFYDEMLTEKLSEWSDKQRHKKDRVGAGKALPAGVSKADAKYYAVAYAKKLYVVSGIKPDYLANVSLDDLTDDEQAKIDKIYDGIKSKNEKFLQFQLERFATPVTAGEAYLQDLRVLMAKNGKVAQRTSYAYIVQVGSYLDPDYTEDRSSRYWSDRVKILLEWLEDFKKRHPHLHVTKAVIHVDELKKPPHLHLEVVPVVESDRGKPLKVSFSEAIKRDGVDAEKYEEKEGKASYDARRQAFSDWTEGERAALATLCKNELGLERKQGDLNLQGVSPDKVKMMMSSIDDNHQRLLRENRELDDKNLAAAAKLNEAENGLKQSVEKKQAVDKELADTKAKLATLQTELEDAESKGLEAKKKKLKQDVETLTAKVIDLQKQTDDASKEITEKRQAFDGEKAKFFGHEKRASQAVDELYQELGLTPPTGDFTAKLTAFRGQISALKTATLDEGTKYQTAVKKTASERQRAKTAYGDEVKQIEDDKKMFASTVSSFFKACGMTPPSGDVTEQVNFLTQHSQNLTKRYNAAQKAVKAEEKRANDEKARADTAYQMQVNAIKQMQTQLNARQTALSARESALDEEVETKATAKFKKKIAAFVDRIWEGYGEHAYKINHRRGGYDKLDAEDVGVRYRDGFITDEQLDATYLSRNKIIREIFQKPACYFAGFAKAVKGEPGIKLPGGLTPETADAWGEKHIKQFEAGERQMR